VLLFFIKKALVHLIYLPVISAKYYIEISNRTYIDNLNSINAAIDHSLVSGMATPDLLGEAGTSILKE